MGILPFFHSFGYTGTLWYPLTTGMSVAYHYNPMDAQTVGEMVKRHQATMLLAKPTCGKLDLKQIKRMAFALTSSLR